MRSAIVITDRPLDLNRLEQMLLSQGDVKAAQGGDPVEMPLAGRVGNEWFGFEPSDELRNDFDEAELLRIKACMSEPHFAQLYYGGTRALNCAVRALPAGRTLIDNNFGALLPLEEVL